MLQGTVRGERYHSYKADDLVLSSQEVKRLSTQNEITEQNRHRARRAVQVGSTNIMGQTPKYNKASLFAVLGRSVSKPRPAVLVLFFHPCQSTTKLEAQRTREAWENDRWVRSLPSS